MGYFRKHKQSILCIGSLLLCAITGILCYRLGYAAAPTETSSFVLSVVEDEDAGFTTFFFEDTQSPYTSMDYLDLTEVSITMDGKTMPLDQAISDELISIEELIMQAQLDAQKGTCIEKFSSERGLTTYVYIYPTYEFIVRHDLFEASDGSCIPVYGFDIVAPGMNRNTSFGWALIDDEGNYIRLLEEDWGLSFECVTVTPTGLELKVDQSGGMQLGELCYESFLLNQIENGRYTSVGFLEGESLANVPESILQNGSASFTLDWSSQFGSLTAGEYELWIDVADVYDQSTVHPLMRKYTDSQEYRMKLTIP